MADMTGLPYTTDGFSPPIPDGMINASLVRVMWAAATVGVSPTAPTVGTRPLLELCWRMAMVGTALETHGNRWGKSPAYNRLDASEKVAVSYFLGMAQTQLACADVLGVPSLVHLDAALAALGKSTRLSRPDFLGIDPNRNTTSVAVEAKGRTHRRDNAALAKAKTQAQGLPAITGVASTLTVASMAYFQRQSYDKRPIWRCRLEDPPTLTRLDDEQISREALLSLHYLPLARAIGSADTTQEGELTRAQLPDLDAWLWAPTSLVETVGNLEPQTGERELKAVGSELPAIIRESTGKFAGLDEASDASSRSDDAQFYLGRNGIGVELGPSWSHNPS